MKKSAGRGASIREVAVCKWLGRDRQYLVAGGEHHEEGAGGGQGRDSATKGGTSRTGTMGKG